ncbi:sulfatase-like hydrolase/transferase [Robiginitalea biformata]|uniref:sulfatase-like hydrolase/transferase n=1 Tax=Robiginitalea biformata TaxID=252307 RepID=UPI00032250A5|nr:sulfatase-like hydrolase/transferase [Robiginitalea biformata]
MEHTLLMAARCFILILALSGCAPEESEPIPPPPNILIVLTDDQGWGDLGINGNSNIRTPNLDSLAISGARFEQFYVQPVCSPTRAEILTGRYAAALGVYSTSAGGERMDPGVPTLGDVFRDAGYRTGLFGKWHNGSQPPYHPNFRGFDEFYGFASGHWAHYFSPELEHNGKFVRGEGYLADDLTARAIQFMGAPDPRPFLAVLSHNTPHSPMQVPDPYWDALQNRPLEMRHREPQLEDTLFTRAALAMVENIDANVGQVVEFLEKSGTRRETIVVFLSDNGPNSFRWNGGMKGRKGSTDEGGVRSPLLISWPGSIPAGLRSAPLAVAWTCSPRLSGCPGFRKPGHPGTGRTECRSTRETKFSKGWLFIQLLEWCFEPAVAGFSPGCRKPVIRYAQGPRANHRCIRGAPPGIRFPCGSQSGLADIRGPEGFPGAPLHRRVSRGRPNSIAGSRRHGTTPFAEEQQVPERELHYRMGE